MPKGRITPESTRQKILEAVNAGERYANIASTYNIGYNTVRRIVKAARQEDTKPDYTPYEYAVDEAVLERMEKLRDRIAELQLDIANYENELECLDKYHLKYMEKVKSG